MKKRYTVIILAGKRRRFGRPDPLKPGTEVICIKEPASKRRAKRYARDFNDAERENPYGLLAVVVKGGAR